MRLVKVLEKEISSCHFEEGKKILNQLVAVLKVLQKNSSKMATLSKGDLGGFLDKVFQPFNFSASVVNQIKTEIYNRKIKRLLVEIGQFKRKWFRAWKKSLVLIEAPSLELKGSNDLVNLIDKIKPRVKDIGEISFCCRKSLLGGFRIFFDFEVIDASFANLFNQIYNQIR